MNETRARSLLLGREDRWRRRWGVAAGLLLVASFVYWSAVVETYPRFHRVLWVEGYALLFVALGAVQAYSNDGLLLSWLLVAAPVFAFLFVYLAAAGSSGVGLVFLFTLAVVAVLGSLGFAVGATARRVVR